MGNAPRRRRAHLDLAPRGHPGVRQHPTREHTARSRCTSRSGSRSSRPACACSAARCDPAFPSLRGPVPRPCRGACAVAGAAVASVDVAIHAVPAAAQSARPRSRSPNRAHGSRPVPDSSWSSTRPTCPPGAQVALTVHDALQSRTAFDASIDGDNLPPTRDRADVRLRRARGRPGNRETAARVPDQRTRRQRRVPARGRPPQRHRRVARALRDPRGRGPGRCRRHADRRPAAQPRVGVAAAGRARVPRGRRRAPINPTTLARPGAERTARPSGHPAGGEPRRAAHAGPEPRDPRRVELAGDEVPRARARSDGHPFDAPPQPGAGRTLRAARPPVARTRRPRGRGHHQQRHPTERALRVASRPSRASSTPTSTRAPRCPDRSTRRRSPPCRARACASSSSRAPR